jgi:integrase
MRRYPSAKDLSQLTRRGRYAVGQNVYLQISKQGTKSWVFRYRRGDRCHHMGLGPYDLLSLAEVRDRGYQARRQLLDGVDPLEAKRSAKRQQRAAQARAMTFKQAAMAYIVTQEPSWRSNRSGVQWTQSLQKYVFPHIGSLLVSDIDTPRVLSALEPIWVRIPETARRIRNRIELVLDYATAHGMRAGDNPAKWRGLLENLLPDQRKSNGVNHHAAMAWKDVPAFISRLRDIPDNAARALELAILCASRAGEVLNARWCEIDLDAATWTIPAKRMKNHKEHRVPLSRRAAELLANLPRVGEFLFVGRGDGPPNRTTLLLMLQRMGHAGLTAHGFRSSFSSWANEITQYAPHIIEMALAHTVGGAVERAYRRGDLLDQRRRLMQDWAEFCDRPNAEGAHD